MEFGQIDEVDLLSLAPQKVSGAWPEASTVNLTVRLPEVAVNPQVKGEISRASQGQRPDLSLSRVHYLLLAPHLCAAFVSWTNKQSSMIRVLSS